MEIPPLDAFQDHSTKTLQKLLLCFCLAFLCNKQLHCMILHPELDSLSHFSMWVIMASGQFAFNSSALPL